MSAVLDAPLLAAVAAGVARHTGVDVTDYRVESLRTAVSDRLEALALGPEEYLARLRADADEAGRLMARVLVPHTGFFRDAAVFEALERRVLPALAAGLPPGEPLRAWVVGAATGEEAWSLAMALDAALPASRRFEVLATDVHEPVLAQASRGRYPLARLAGIPPDRMERNFVSVEGGEREVSERLQARVRFAVHDLMGPRLAPADAILASFQLISCRNVLIWFDERLQRKALERLIAVLAPGGALVLGQSEGLPVHEGRLRPVRGLEASLRIFEREGAL